MTSIYQTQHRIEVANEQARSRQEYNQYLTKLATKCDGYPVNITGIVFINRSDEVISDSKIRSSIKNSFYKLGGVTINATNVFGSYARELILSEVDDIRFFKIKGHPLEKKLIGSESSYGGLVDGYDPYWFELTYEHVKPLNKSGLLFAKYGNSEINCSFDILGESMDFVSLYGIGYLSVRSVIFDKADTIPITKNHEFRN